MKNAVIIHGMPSREDYYNNSPEADSQSNCHWLPWIQKELLLRDVLAQTPEMPVPYEPEYNAWKKIFEGFEINKETILIGHSCGGGFLLRYLSENNVVVSKVVLVAPWIDPEKILKTGMFEFEIDANILSKVKNLAIFISNDDEEDILKSVEIIKSKIQNVRVVEFKDMGHFCYSDMNRRDFPELLAELYI